jgi:RecA-family ATPase
MLLGGNLKETCPFLEREGASDGPAVLKATFVLVVEGPKDCETARKLGIVATTNASGANAPWRPGYSESLRDKRLCLIADADAPGVAHTKDAARSLVGVAQSVKLIEALPGAGVKDLTDFVSKFPDLAKAKDALLALIKDSPEITPADVDKWESSKFRGKENAPVPGVLASEVKPEKVRWLWTGYLALGKITIFEGDPDEGKSTVALDLIARITRGSEMPDGRAGMPASGAVVVSLEDGIADTIVPRLMAANAELSRVRLIQTIKGPDGIERTPTLPVDLLAIEAAIKAVHAKTVVSDPLVATLAGETNSFRDQDMRRVLAPVAATAERTGVAVLVIRHLNKGNNPNPKYRGGGSIGILGAARADYLFGANPDDERSKIMANVKMNLAEKPPAMKYRLQAEQVTFEGAIIETVRVTWEGTSQHTAKSILAEAETEEDCNALMGAENFLTEFLGDRPKGSKKVKLEAKAAGISERTLFRAKDLLAVKAKHCGFAKDGKWEWELPKAANPEPKAANSRSLARLEQISETKPVNSTSSFEAAKVENMAVLRGENGNISSGLAPGLPLRESKPEDGLRGDADSIDV